MPHGGFQRLAQRDDLLVQRVARRRLAAFGGRLLHAVDAVLLDDAGRDLGEPHLTEERQ